MYFFVWYKVLATENRGFMNIRHRVLVEENVGNQLLNLRLVSK
ncbi:unknow [Vibrio campbellii]|nr:unknow [Vibrio campbellii]